MKRLTITLAVLAMMMMSTVAFAEDGAALFGAKCAMCHGADGGGKIGPSLKGKSADVVSGVLTNGGKTKNPHMKPFSATPEQVKAIADFVATLK